MSSTNKTTYYELPQFVDSDLFNPLVDDNDAYDKIDTALHNIADAEASDASEIVAVKGRVTTAEGKIEALETQNGSEALVTTAQTLSGAVNELKSGEDSLDGRLDVVENDINNASTGLKAKVSAIETQNGSEVLTTTAQTLSGAVNELDAEVKPLMNKIKRALVDTANVNIKYADSYHRVYLGYQGSCYDYDDNTIIVAKLKANNIITLVKVNATNGNVILSNDLTLYHANCLSYNDGKIYVSPLSSNVSNVTEPQSIIIVDANTLTITGNIDMSTKLAGVGYSNAHIASYVIDIVTNIAYMCIITSGNIKFLKVDDTLEDITPANRTEFTGTHQMLEVYDGIGYFIKSNPSCIYVYDLNKKEFIKIINYSDTSNNGLRLGELQSLSAYTVDGGIVFYFGCSHQNSGAYRNVYYGGIIDLYGLISDDEEYKFAYGYRTAYVDYNTTSWLQDGTTNNPYGCIDSALEYLSKRGGGSIFLQGTGGTAYDVGTLSLLGFDGINVNINGTSAPYVFEGLAVRNSIVFVNGVTFEKGDNVTDYAVKCSIGNIKLQDCNYDSAQIINGHMYVSGTNSKGNPAISLSASELQLSCNNNAYPIITAGNSGNKIKVDYYTGTTDASGQLKSPKQNITNPCHARYRYILMSGQQCMEFVDLVRYIGDSNEREYYVSDGTHVFKLTSIIVGDDMVLTATRDGVAINGARIDVYIE